MTTQDVMVPMRDGVRLHTGFCLPDGGGPFATVMFRATRAVSLGSPWARVFVEAGYAYVMQSVRGFGKSEGDPRKEKDQAPDGVDTLEWLVAQPWCNGLVGTVGGSELGEYQLRTAFEGHPAHRAMCPYVPSYGSSNHHYGGAFMFPRTFIHSARGNMEDYAQHDWMPHFYTLPVIKMLEASGLETTKEGRQRFYTDIPLFFDHPEDADFTDPEDFEPFKKLNTPNLMVTGWYDHCSVAAFEFYQHSMAYGSDSQKQNTHLVVGPWDHDIDPKSIADYDFGDAAERDHRAGEIAFFDRHLRGDTSGDALPPVRVFVMGRNEWRDEEAWPLDRAVETHFYMHSERSVRGAWSRGGLSTVPPEDEPPDRFTYDPANPVPSWGGANCGPSRALPMRRGPRDQRITLYRDDVLVYYSEPMEEPLEVTGLLKMVLFAASSARDTDFTAKLMDVAPNGDARLLSDGVIRARFRNGLHRPELLTPGEPVRYEIDLWHTSNEFQPGHRIGLAISSSNFPRLPRNLNTGGDNARDSDTISADQTVFHDSARPSHLILPVIKG
ncbi:MAG: CocE/NonD family hydrolase [Candidatus Latescibacteria bacterium]|nr:CocE/NonD family hydrolase [Candidatus Latescibacterota bacterium]